MTDDPRFDLDLHKKDVLDLSTPDGIVAFFARLRYDTAPRTLHSAASLSLSEAVARPLHRIELIAERDLFQVYLVELKTVTVAATRALVRSFRDRGGDFLFVVTSGDYSHLDFVFLDRLADNFSSNAIGTATVGVRPRTLTVERRKPSTIALRVLRRFTWTEPDRFAQVDKIRSAYAVAEWSEEEGLFNNRALFSDHYLKSRLREDAVWRDDSTTAGYRELRDLLLARSASATTDEESLRQNFFEPALRALGFEPRVNRREPNDVESPDYELLRSPGDKQPLALCLTYPWMRYLDGKDLARDMVTPDENPGAIVVSLLQKSDVPWIVVTNGKLWRLYSKRTHSRATSYFEVDLEEVIAGAAARDSDPFRYFWLLFRRRAFELVSISREGREERVPFLDRLLLESEDYAKELGERLKERIFDRVFPRLAEGFVARWEGTPTAADLLQTYRATLTLLYRLLFLLYAESRDLLPAREVRGYYEKSLAKLKKEIAEAAGPLEDEIETNLKKKLDGDSTALYERLSELFAVIDRGDGDLNVPFYNGGLFATLPEEDDDSDEAAAARFLRDHAVPDRYLAAAIDLLSREDDARAGRIYIDYKSLGVRHLGSIYEGLLEFRLRFATERLGIVREKRRDVYKPWRELDENKKGRLERDGRFVKKAQLYLENDKHERKATGSYYTPDYIVMYVVEHAVGPVVKEKLDALRPRLREASTWHKKQIALATAKGESLTKYEYGPVVESKWRELIDDVFDIKVLDPAMGSGHFLVEAVDFITDHVIDFLNSFPWNPVTAHLRFTRDQILESMEKQKVTIDPQKLTDVNLLKRHVLKRCIYGVDVNPMAVELAKVSLWLDCFTLGAPLSFLDHHLRCGNSLVGVTIEEVDARLREGTQASLFSGNKFAGVKTSVAGMIAIGELPDITPDQVKSSRSEFKRASSATEWARRLLDVYTSQWFGNEAVRTRRGEVNPVLDFLGDKASELWAASPQDSSLSDAYLEVVNRADVASGQQRFFHWPLQFPEVFFSQHRERADEGFDAIVGNPPFGASVDEDAEGFIEQHFGVSTGKFESYAYFMLLAGTLLRRCGLMGMVTPNVWLTIRSYHRVRMQVFEALGLVAIAESPSAFQDAWVNTISVIARSRTSHAENIAIARPVVLVNGSVETASIQNPWPVRYFFSAARIPKDTYQVHFQVSQDEHDLLNRIGRSTIAVGDLLVGTTGFQAYHNTLHSQAQIRSRYLHAPTPRSGTWKPYISGTDIKSFRWSYGKQEYIDYSGDLYRQPDRNFFVGPRIVIQEIASRGERKVNAALIRDEVYSDNTTLILKPRSPKFVAALPAILAIVSSRFFTWFLLKTSDKPYASGDFSRMNVHDFLRLPLPHRFAEWLQSPEAHRLELPQRISDAELKSSSELLRLGQMIFSVSAVMPRGEVERSEANQQLDALVFAAYGLSSEDTGVIDRLFVR